MKDSRPSASDEVEQLLRNAELRNEFERYLDESMSRVNVQHLTLAAENEFLASDVGLGTGAGAAHLPLVRSRTAVAAARVAWPRRTCTRSSAEVDPQALPEADRPGLHRSSQRPGPVLFDLSVTSCPAREKKLDYPGNYLHWDCTGPSGDPEVWLRYYADEEERGGVGGQLSAALAVAQLPPPYPRPAPRAGELIHPKMVFGNSDAAPAVPSSPSVYTGEGTGDPLSASLYGQCMAM